MKSYFFNAEPTEDLVNHPTGYDREYDADDHAAFFAPFFSEAGVMAGSDSNACKVSVQSGTTLKIAAGAVYVKGRMGLFEGTETITVEEDCKICARMNKSADVRAFQLVAVTEKVTTEDIYDLELASVHLEAVTGGYEAQVTDTRTFLSFMGQPAYYPPNSDSLPYVLWLYALGFPMDVEQEQMVEGNPSLMAIFNASLGAMRPSSVNFTASQWTGEDTKTLSIPKTSHGRQTEKFGYTLYHLVSGAYKRNTWAVRCTDVSYDAGTEAITLTGEDAYDGKIVCFAG